jgi:hypothetical protein
VHNFVASVKMLPFIVAGLGDTDGHDDVHGKARDREPPRKHCP